MSILYYKKAFEKFLTFKNSIEDLVSNLQQQINMDVEYSSFFDNTFFESDKFSQYGLTPIERMTSLIKAMYSIIFMTDLFHIETSLVNRIKECVSNMENSWIGAYSEYMKIKANNILIRTEEDNIKLEVLKMRMKTTMINPNRILTYRFVDADKFTMGRSTIEHLVSIGDFSKNWTVNISLIHNVVYIRVHNKYCVFDISFNRDDATVDPMLISEISELNENIHNVAVNKKVMCKDIPFIVSMNSNNIKVMESI